MAVYIVANALPIAFFNRWGNGTFMSRSIDPKRAETLLPKGVLLKCYAGIRSYSMFPGTELSTYSDTDLTPLKITKDDSVLIVGTDDHGERTFIHCFPQQ